MTYEEKYKEEYRKEIRDALDEIMEALFDSCKNPDDIQKYRTKIAQLVGKMDILVNHV